MIWIEAFPSMDAPSRGDRCLRFAQGQPQQGGKLAGNPQDAGIADHVGQDIEVEDRVAHVVHERHAHRGVGIQDDDALVLLGDAQLLFGADHREGFHPADDRPFEGGEHEPRLMTVVEPGAFAGVGDLDRLGQGSRALVFQQVRRAGQNGERLGAAIIQLAEHQPIGVGVRQHLQDRGGDELIPLPGEPGNAEIAPVVLAGRCEGQPDHGNILDLQPHGKQRAGGILKREVNIHKFF